MPHPVARKATVRPVSKSNDFVFIVFPLFNNGQHLSELLIRIIAFLPRAVNCKLLFQRRHTENDAAKKAGDAAKCEFRWIFGEKSPERAPPEVFCDIPVYRLANCSFVKYPVLNSIE